MRTRQLTAGEEEPAVTAARTTSLKVPPRGCRTAATSWTELRAIANLRYAVSGPLKDDAVAGPSALAQRPRYRGGW